MNTWLLSLLAITLTALTISVWPHQLMAQSKTFANVIPFATSTDRIGFFDQNSGSVYIYDNNLSECVFKGKMSDLGGTIHKLSDNTQSIAPSGNTY
jgi:hypothetical protein